MNNITNPKTLIGKWIDEVNKFHCGRFEAIGMTDPVFGQIIAVTNDDKQLLTWNCQSNSTYIRKDIWKEEQSNRKNVSLLYQAHFGKPKGKVPRLLTVYSLYPNYIFVFRDGNRVTCSLEVSNYLFFYMKSFLL